MNQKESKEYKKELKELNDLIKSIQKDEELKQNKLYQEIIDELSKYTIAGKSMTIHTGSGGLKMINNALKQQLNSLSKPIPTGAGIMEQLQQSNLKYKKL